METLNYKSLLQYYSLKTVEEARQLFWDEVAWDWMDIYKENFIKHGELTLQNFFTFSFVIDHIWPHLDGPDLPDTRVIGAFGIAGVEVKIANRRTMRSYWGSMTKAYGHLGCQFDKGHFIAHGFGGPIDVNLFPQRRDVNRGWSPEGKRYREMERYVAAHPGTLVFSRPIYSDLTCCPSHIEYGYCDPCMNIAVEMFPNR